LRGEMGFEPPHELGAGCPIAVQPDYRGDTIGAECAEICTQLAPREQRPRAVHEAELNGPDDPRSAAPLFVRILEVEPDLLADGGA
jgi:hypothetical protein